MRTTPRHGLDLARWKALRQSFRPLLVFREVLRRKSDLEPRARALILAWGDAALALDAETEAVQKTRRYLALDFNYLKFVADCIRRERGLPLNLSAFEPNLRELVLACDAEPILWYDELAALLATRAHSAVVTTTLEAAREDFRKKRAYHAVVRQHRDLLCSSLRWLRSSVLAIQAEHGLPQERLDAH